MGYSVSIPSHSTPEATSGLSPLEGVAEGSEEEVAKGDSPAPTFYGAFPHSFQVVGIEEKV